MTALDVLCLDIEGGHGGSSRSLLASLTHVDRARVSPEVWCRKGGRIVESYQTLGIPCTVHPDMPKVSSLPLMSRNLAVYGLFARDWLRSGAFRRRLLDRARRADVIHMNHEALFFLGRWLKQRCDTPICQHIRTNLWDTPFARWQTRLLSLADHRVYITPNEVDTYRRLGGTGPGTVIYNIADPPSAGVAPHPAVPRDGRLRIACLSNYSWLRGIDRLVEVACELAARGRRDVSFVIAGDMQLTRSLPGRLGQLGAQGKTLADWAEERGVADMMTFLGHVPNPEQVLAACDLLAKPTREANPWGRDIIEGLAAGLPVLSVGTFDEFVEDGVTGILQAQFDAAALAERVASLADDRDQCRRMGQAGRDRIATLCSGPERAADLVAVWDNLRRRQ